PARATGPRALGAPRAPPRIAALLTTREAGMGSSMPSRRNRACARARPPRGGCDARRCPRRPEGPGTGGPRRRDCAGAPREATTRQAHAAWARRRHWRRHSRSNSATWKHQGTRRRTHRHALP
ncbi:unnamed protein product, partial [Prorocentrum cordatum]